MRNRNMLSFGLSWGLGVAMAMAVASTNVRAAAARTPMLDPDYTGLIIPPNIAPLNFVILDPDAVRHEVHVSSSGGLPIEIKGKGVAVEIPVHSWRKLLESNLGHPLYVDIRLQNRAGTWTSYDRVTNTISSDPIDGYLVYRLLRPVYNIYGPIGIYQRALGTYEERPILENKQLDQGCVNCHTFLSHSPNEMALHIRNKAVNHPMLFIRSNQVTRLDKTSGYISWHPSGRLLAFSVNKFALLFHTQGETRDLYDGASDLGIYRVDSNVVMNPLPIARPDRLETWPSWAPDGRHLYFCSAPKLKMERLTQIRYDLMRVSYEIDLDRWGEPEVLVSARDTRLSAAQPRLSPDGRWLMFCLSPYGNFPAYSTETDLYMMDLPSRTMRRLDEVNSEHSDSWHCWSSNGRWLVVSSKRRDGLFTRPHFTHMTAEGQFSKPFLLPQREPEFYDSFTKTYNLPEFIKEPVTVSTVDLVRGVFRPRATVKPIVIDMGTATAEHEAEEGRAIEAKP